MEKIQTRQQKLAQWRHRIHNALLTAAVVVFLLICIVINLCSKTKSFSEAENRNLAQRPELSITALADGSYFSDLTAYYADQFFARDKWISMKLQSDVLLGRKESGGVYLCDDDYLMAAPVAPDEAALTETIRAVNEFTTNHQSISARMILVPSAAAIMPERLPRNAPVRDQLRDIDRIGAQLDSLIQIIDVAPVLQEHAAEEIYYRTDHHWTSLGAYDTFLAAAGTLGIENPITDYDVYWVTDSFEGTLSSRSGSHKAKDGIQIYVPQGSAVSYYVTYDGQRDRVCSIYRSECLQSKDKYTVFFGGNHPLVEIQTTANNDRALLVLKDSYANCFMQFLIPYYEKIVMIDPRYYYDNIETVLSSYGVTDILYLYSADTFFTDTSLADVLNSGASTNEAAPDRQPALPEAGETVDSSAADSAAAEAPQGSASAPDVNTQIPASPVEE